MREESAQSFPRPNDRELVDVYIKSELKTAGIELQRLSINGTNGSVTTDKKVPEEIMSSIREYADYKGITIKFLSSG